jgi:hypothetical protein
MYMSMMDTHNPAWKTIFQHIKDHPDQPFLFHCTGMVNFCRLHVPLLKSNAGGKDRTGTAAALVLGLIGCPADAIAQEYALSRLGVEPARAALTKKLAGGDPSAIDMKSERYKTMAKITCAMI